MSRALLFPLTMLLLIATAVAMLASAMILPMSEVTALTGPVREDVVERFYAAVNEAIATGNPASLRRVVTPAFTDDNPLPGVQPGRDGLETYLATLHEADPALRLEPRVIFADARQVMTRVDVARGLPDTAQPVTLGGQQAVWSPVEVLRVADGVVVGRWGHTDGLSVARPLAAAAFDLATPTPRVIGLARITQEPGTRWDAPRVAGPRLFVMQQGVLDVQAAPSPGTTSHSIAASAGRVHPPIRATLGAGQSWQAPAGAVTSTTNTGSAASQVLVVTFVEPQIPNEKFAKVPGLPSGVTVEVLAGDLATPLTSGPVTVTLERIALTPQGDLTLSSTDEPIMVAVEAGQLEVTTSGIAWVRRHRDGVSTTSRATTLNPDNGLLLQPPGMVTLRNREPSPAQALVLTVRRASADRESSP